MTGERSEFAWIAVDLGIDQLDQDSGGKPQWCFPPRRKQPDFCALFAAEGLRELENYLAKWAAYQD